MLFILDHDVDVEVGRMLRHFDHTCVTVGSAGLATASDDDVSVFADNLGGVLLTHDRGMIGRRRRNTFGKHVLLDCHEWDAAEILKDHLPRTIELLPSREAIVLRVSRDGVVAYDNQWI